MHDLDLVGVEEPQRRAVPRADPEDRARWNIECIYNVRASRSAGIDGDRLAADLQLAVVERFGVRAGLDAADRVLPRSVGRTPVLRGGVGQADSDFVTGGGTAGRARERAARGRRR